MQIKQITKEEMLVALAEIATEKEIEINWNTNSKEDNFKLLSICDGLSYNIQYIKGKTSEFIVDVLEDNYDSAQDDEEITLIFAFTRKSDNQIGYLQFKGRYSSWDSSSYYCCDIVYPRKVEMIVYETKLTKKD